MRSSIIVVSKLSYEKTYREYSLNEITKGLEVYFNGN